MTLSRWGMGVGPLEWWFVDFGVFLVVESCWCRLFDRFFLCLILLSFLGPFRELFVQGLGFFLNGQQFRIALLPLSTLLKK